MVTLTLTLADGQSFSRSFAKLPRYWKSVAMSLAPYGSDFRGATYLRERKSA